MAEKMKINPHVGELSKKMNKTNLYQASADDNCLFPKI